MSWPRVGAKAGVINAPHYSVENLRMGIRNDRRFGLSAGHILSFLFATIRL